MIEIFMKVICRLIWTLACPGMRQGAPISALIKPIGLCGTQFFYAFWVPRSPIGLISAEIEAPCRIPGHAIGHMLILIYYK